MPQNTVLQRTFILISAVWKWCDLSPHASAQAETHLELGRTFASHLVHCTASQLQSRVPELIRSIWFWLETPDPRFPGRKILASSEWSFTRQLSFQLPNKKSLQHKYAVVKPLKEATDLIIFLLKKHLEGPRYFNNSQFQSRWHTTPFPPPAQALHWDQVSILRREAWMVFIVFAVCFPARLLVDVWDFSSIRLSLDPFLLWWTVEPPEPWASEERVTGRGGTRSVFEFTSERTDRSPSEHWDRRYWR